MSSPGASGTSDGVGGPDMAPHIPARDILRAVDDYYSVRLRAFGPTHLGVDWRSEESQRLRFDVLLRAIRPRWVGPNALSRTE